MVEFETKRKQIFYWVLGTYLLAMKLDEKYGGCKKERKVGKTWHYLTN